MEYIIYIIRNKHKWYYTGHGFSLREDCAEHYKYKEQAYDIRGELAYIYRESADAFRIEDIIQNDNHIEMY